LSKYSRGIRGNRLKTSPAFIGRPQALGFRDVPPGIQHLAIQHDFANPSQLTDANGFQKNNVSFCDFAFFLNI
jgi:hypothetical protein